MIPFSACSRWLNRLSGILIRRPRARRRPAARLETLEQRLNLSAVLVVETIDAYWLIEDSEFDASSTSGEIDAASEWFASADEAEEWIAPWLPDSVVPVAADGSLLNNIEADMVWSLLGDLWVGEEDFYAQDVLAMTFFTDTTMDAIIDGGLFDGSNDNGNSSHRENLLAEEILTSDSFAHEDSNFNNLLADFEESSPQAENVGLGNLVDEPSNLTDADALAALASAKVDQSMMAFRINLDAATLTGPSPAINEYVSTTMATVAVQDKAAPATRQATNTQQFADSLVNEPIEMLAAANARGTSQAIESAGLANVDSFFARLPTALQIGVVRLPLMRRLRTERDATAAFESDLPASSDPQDSLSYSQWASLIGVVGLSAGSLYQGQAGDRREERAHRPSSRAARKCPVAS